MTPNPTDDSATSERDALSQLTADFSETVRTLFAAGSVTDTLDTVVNLAVATIEGCDFAGIFLVEEGVVRTPVQTDPIVREIDDMQHDSGEGPCLDAITRGIVVYAEDLTDNLRWPDFSSAAIAGGIRCVLAIPLLSNGSSGALNLYTRYPAAFGVVDRAKGAILASLANQALLAAHARQVEDQRIHNLFAALSSREIVGQAQGILIERERITASEAFEVLRRASQHLNVKLREVALTLIETGESPEIGAT